MEKGDWIKIGIVIVVIIAIALAYSQFTGNAVSLINLNCVDSDGGQDLNVKGTAKGTLVKHTDRCVGRTWIKEAYCDENNRVRVVQKLCNNECEDGVCLDP